MRNHFGGDILRAKLLFRTRWKIGKLLGTIIKGGIAIKKWRYVVNPSEVTRSNKLRCNRAKGCFGIIGPRIFEDFLTVIMTITKQFLIFRSGILMVLLAIMMCNVAAQGMRSGVLTETFYDRVTIPFSQTNSRVFKGIFKQFSRVFQGFLASKRWLYCCCRQ